MYGKPGANPRNATRYSVSACRRGSKCTSRVRAPGTASKKPSGARFVSDLAPATALRFACSYESSGYSTRTAPSATSRKRTPRARLNPKSKTRPPKLQRRGIQNPKSSLTGRLSSPPPEKVNRNSRQDNGISRPGRAGVAREKEGDESEPRGGVEQRQVRISGSSEGPRQIGSAEAKNDHGHDEQNVEEKIRRDDVFQEIAVASREHQDRGPEGLRPERVAGDGRNIQPLETPEKDPVPRHRKGDARA